MISLTKSKMPEDFTLLTTTSTNTAFLVHHFSKTAVAGQVLHGPSREIHILLNPETSNISEIWIHKDATAQDRSDVIAYICGYDAARFHDKSQEVKSILSDLRQRYNLERPKS